LQIADVFLFMSNMPSPALPMSVGAKCEKKNIELVGIEEELVACGKSIAKKASGDPQWLNNLLDEMEETTKKYFSVSRAVLKTPLEKMTTGELSETFKMLHNAYFDSHKCAAWFVPTDLVNDFIAQDLKKWLEEKIKQKKLELSPGVAFSILSQPKKESALFEEKKGFLLLLDKLLSDKKLSAFFREKSILEIEKELPEKFSSFDKLLVSHWKKFEWIFFMYEGPLLEKSFFIGELKKNLDKGMYIAMEIEESKKILKEQEKLVETIATSELDRMILSFPKRLIETKAIRKDAMYFGSVAIEKVCKEIAKRLGIGFDQVRYMMQSEVLASLEGKITDFKVFEDRIEFCVFLLLKGKCVSLVGKEAKEWYEENMKQFSSKEVSTLIGTPVFSGFVKGRVRLINHPNEMLKMNPNDILVSHATNPNLLPAMAKAAAIITDMGGITCHAAIVSREFRIPCVVGTKIATQVLKDGDLVEVDAEKGTIKILEKNK